MPGIADGVEDVDNRIFPELGGDDRTGYIHFMTTRWHGIKVNEDMHTFTITDKKEYFKEKYSEFQKALKILSEASFEDYVDGLTEVWSLNKAYDDEHYVYVVSLEEEYYEEEKKPNVIPLIPEIYTLDDFLRSHDDGEVYYIGSIFDYHY